MVKICIFGSSNGEGILIDAEGFLIVIDAYGGKKITKNHVASYITKILKRNKIDLLTVSHTHSDHYTGIPYLLEKFQVEKFLSFPTTALSYQKQAIELGKELYSSDKDAIYIIKKFKKDFKKLLAPIENYKQQNNKGYFIAAIQDKSGCFLSQKLPNGENLSLRIAGPSSKFCLDPHEYFIKNKEKLSLSDIGVFGISGDKQNLFSSIIELKIENKNFLFLGDATDESIESFSSDMIEYDFIKVSHHGSPNGNPRTFWNKIAEQKRPCLAAITNHITHELPELGIIEMIRIATKQTGGDCYCVPQNEEKHHIEFKF